MYLETLEKLDIELTNTCNLKCPYCLKVKPSLKEFVKNFQELDYEVLTSFITKLKKYKLKEVILMGSIWKIFIWSRKKRRENTKHIRS